MASTLPGWRQIDSHGPARFLVISPKVAFSTSKSDSKLDESIEDPGAEDPCSILLSHSYSLDSLESPPLYTCKQHIRTTSYICLLKLIIIPSNYLIIPQLSLPFSPIYFAQNDADIFAASLLVEHMQAYYIY